MQTHEANAGRPSIDPVVFVKLQWVSYFAGIRAGRHRMEVVADRLSIWW